MATTAELKIRHKVNKDLNIVRAVESAVKKAKPSKLKLGDETVPHIPHDMEIMFLGKVMDTYNRQQVRMANMLAGFLKDYGEGNVPPEIEEKLLMYKKFFKDDFERQKKIISAIVELHPLALKLCKIRGFTAYQLGIIMAHIKDPLKFEYPSKLFVYAGVAPKNGIVLTKATLAIHRMQKHEKYQDAEGNVPDNFKEFGFHMSLKSRMFVIIECLIKQKGFFFDEYQRMKQRLIEKAKVDGKAWKVTEEEAKESKVMKEGDYYMVGRNNQSLVMWAHRNASWRQARTLMHLIYCEWLELLGKQARDLYAIEYLGHSKLITIDEVLTYEARKASQLGDIELDSEIV